MGCPFAAAIASALGRLGLAGYVSVPKDALALKPADITFEQAVAIPTYGFIALSGLHSDSSIK